MTKTLRTLTMSLLLAPPLACAADPAFYFVDIGEKGDAILFSDAQRLTRTDLSYAFLDRANIGCCFKAGRPRGAAKAAARDGDGNGGDLMSDDDRPIFTQVGHMTDPAKPRSDLAYGLEGMQAVTQKGRDAYQITLRNGPPVFVRTCYTTEGLRLKLYRGPGDKVPYASFYYYLGYEVERTCR